jgi:hypothetical protein
MFILNDIAEFNELFGVSPCPSPHSLTLSTSTYLSDTCKQEKEKEKPFPKHYVNGDISLLRMKPYTYNKNNYKIIHYNKLLLKQNPELIKTIGLFRSVILNEDNQLVCFSPPKAVSCDTFTDSLMSSFAFVKKEKEEGEVEEKYIEYIKVWKWNIVAEELVDGTMINVFWNGGLDCWEIASRNTVGCEIPCFKEKEKDTCTNVDDNSCNCNSKVNKTFRDMFFEVFNANTNTYNKLNKNYCYSFVLQHPNNWIVYPITTPQIYLVDAYEILHEGIGLGYPKVKVVNVYEKVKKELTLTNSNRGFDEAEAEALIIKFPQIFETWNETDNGCKWNQVVNTYASMNTPYNIKGVVFYGNGDKTVRCKMKNPNYEYIKHLKGRQLKLQYRYFCYRKEGIVKDILKNHPEYKKDFNIFRNLLHNFTQTLHKNYISCFCNREKQLGQFPANFRPHLIHLHNEYSYHLKEKKGFINAAAVINYINNLGPKEIMRFLNYEPKRRVDLITKLQL